MLTFEQFFNKAMIEHPSLYASTSYHESKLRVCDHAFNTIGNGADEAIIFGDWTIQPVPKHYFDGSKQLFWVSDPKTTSFREINLPDGRIFRMKTGGESLGVMTEEEAVKIPGVTEDHLTSTGNTDTQARDFYPNFSKTYSMVWRGLKGCESEYDAKNDEWVHKNHTQLKFEDLPVDWRDAAIWFYKEAQTYFNDPTRYCGYHEFFGPNSSAETYEKFIGKRLAAGQSYEQISADYECEFAGDYVKFGMKRWEKKLAKIKSFIEETIGHLENMK